MSSTQPKKSPTRRTRKKTDAPLAEDLGPDDLGFSERRVNPDRRKSPLDQIAVDLPVVHSELVRLRSEVRVAKAAWRFTIIVVSGAIIVGGVLFFRQYEQAIEQAEDRINANYHDCLAANERREQIGLMGAAFRDSLVNASGGATAARARNPEGYDTFIKEINGPIAKISAQTDCEAAKAREQKAAGL